jgi:Flp pilus assembly protein TadG
MRLSQRGFKQRRGAIVILVAVLLIVFMSMVSFAIDMGYITTVQTQLQRASDAAALAAAAEMNRSGLAGAVTRAQQIGQLNTSSGGNISIPSSNVEFGVWNLTARTFTPSAAGAGGNAVRVRITQTPNLFFARAMGIGNSTVTSESIAIATPRDIAFVVDLSGSMNDDTETTWATPAINSRYASAGYPTIGNTIMQDIFTDFSLGTYPGTNQQIGTGLGTFYNTYSQWGYAEMTKDGGPLSGTNIATTYRILPTDVEVTRKTKAYSWIIDNQIKNIMPNAVPAPNITTNYSFWARYIDYVIQQASVTVPPPPSPPSTGGGSGGGGSGGSGGGGSGGTNPPPPPPPPSPPPIGWLNPSLPVPGLLDASPESLVAQRVRKAFGPTSNALVQLLPSAILAGWGQPPNSRGSIPPSVDGNTRLIGKFNNPNTSSFPTATSPTSFRNTIGPRSYINFVLDHGRDLLVNGAASPISINSSICPWHSESTDGGTFDFPPREQPTHACRRSIIAAMSVIQSRNSVNPSPDQRDWVSVVTFDTATPGPQVAQTLTSDYTTAMRAVTRLQAVGDRNASTATESGLIRAQNLLKPTSQGGVGREFSDKVVVLLTDGVPNVTTSPTSTISNYMTSNPDSNFYGGGYWWLDGPIMQSKMMAAKQFKTYPVGIGLGTDYNFMDRMARTGTTANAQGQSPRGSGNPAEYETRLKQIFQDIISNAGVRLVK